MSFIYQIIDAGEYALKHANSFRIRLRKLFVYLATKENTKQVKLILNYFIKHKNEAADLLSNSEKDSASDILDIYLQFANHQNIF